MPNKKTRTVMANWHWRLAVLVLAPCLGLAACTKYPPLDEAIQCNQYSRQPDGNWVTTTDVSLNYDQNGTRFQNNFSKGVVLKGADGEQAVIVAALNKKCAPTQ